MRKIGPLFLTLALTGLASPVFAANEPAAQPEPHSYELQSFYADARQYHVGDTVPDVYRSKKYEITEWQKRHLPAPQADSHWTYIGGNYVQITQAEGKIVLIESGDIFFH